ncbi:serine hydrolase [Sphingobium amiense]|uniref:Serine hydrolase n=1 Tax=Sphingobium amiense TaxID=135719 RepID=A0A494WB24_9SPHN|nr:serine hydrolase domain-containing protein [Sphingobium amiense]BBD97950.1 serine hydrolase [Sphingobium amiense]
MIPVTDRDAARATGMNADRLDALVDDLDRRYIARGRLPHMQLLLSRDEQPLLSVVRGHAREGGEPLHEDALYRIASMTKPVTSVAFMMLVEEGLVALDTPVTAVIPEFSDLRVGSADGPRPERPMRMIDLLRHTSGLTYGLQRQTPIDARYRALGLDEFQQKRTSDEFVAALAGLPLEFSPGARWNYSVSTDVLGVVVERLEGANLESVFQRRIFKPLGMADTTFMLPDARADRMTDAWRLDEGGGISVADHGARSGWRRTGCFHSGGGGLVSSVADYHRFARMLLRGGELDGVRLLRPDTVAAMRSNQLPGGGDLASLSSAMFSEADYQGVGFGLGFAMGLAGGEYYWGGVFSTYFWIDPVHRTIGIFMTQHLPSSTYPIRAQLRQGVAQAILKPSRN